MIWLVRMCFETGFSSEALDMGWGVGGGGGGAFSLYEPQNGGKNNFFYFWLGGGGIFQWVFNINLSVQQHTSMCMQTRAPVCKRLRSPRIDSEESIPPGWESIPGLLKRFTNKGSGRCF